MTEKIFQEKEIPNEENDAICDFCGNPEEFCECAVDIEEFDSDEIDE